MNARGTEAGPEEPFSTAAVARRVPARTDDPGAPVREPVEEGTGRIGRLNADPTEPTRSARVTAGSGLVDLPEVAHPDPSASILAEPFVPESKRFCSVCSGEVGRTRDGVAGSTEGYCPRDGTPYSFAPKLHPGDLVGGQYEVAGCVAHGGLGWIYLAKDRRVGDDALVRWVVLKGLLNTGDEAAVAAAIGERRFLAEVDHPGIVKIYNFVEHDGAGYIVMAHVGGVSLRDLMEQDSKDAGPSIRLTPALACEYVLRSLPALAYMHERGLLYCDFKPDNVIATQHGMTLIDLGAVSRAGDGATHFYGTLGYQAPELAETGPTIASDLYTVSRTLAALCTGTRPTPGTGLPDQASVPVFAEHDSLYRFLCKGAAAEPAARFASAAAMAEQLLGVLRELVATDESDAPGTSHWFTGDFRAGPEAADWRALPALRVAADDEAAGFLATIGGVGPAEQLDRLELAPATAEVELRRAQILIRLGRWGEAEETLAAFAAAHPADWRARWRRGVMALARGAPEPAREEFLGVYGEVPGELAPKLALGVAAESAGDVSGAIPWYDVVSRTDHSYTTAAFGLARCRAAAGDREGSIAAFERVPDTSSAYVDAAIGRITAILRPDDAGHPTIAEIRSAADAAGELDVEERRRDELVASALEAALERVTAGAALPGDEGTVAGHPLTERDVRLGLEAIYRRLARAARSQASRIELVDRANAVRPRTLT